MFLKWCCTMFLTFQHPSLPAVPLALNPRLVGTPIILLRVFVLYPVFLGQFGGCEAFKDWHVGIPGWNIRSEHVPVKAHWAFRCRVHLKTRHLRLPQVLPSWRKPSWHVGRATWKKWVVCCHCPLLGEVAQDRHWCFLRLWVSRKLPPAAPHFYFQGGVLEFYFCACHAIKMCRAVTTTEELSGNWRQKSNLNFPRSWQLEAPVDFSLKNPSSFWNSALVIEKNLYLEMLTQTHFLAWMWKAVAFNNLASSTGLGCQRNQATLVAVNSFIGPRINE